MYRFYLFCFDLVERGKQWNDTIPAMINSELENLNRAKLIKLRDDVLKLQEMIDHLLS